MATKFSYNQIDRSNEKTSTGFWGPTLTALNFTGELAKADAVRVAAAAISLCNESALTANVIVHNASPVTPSSPFAQRELLVKVYYVDTVNGRKGTTSIPGPDLSLLTLSGDEVLLADGDVMEAFVTALEDTLSRDGNAITVTRAVVMGRNS